MGAMERGKIKGRLKKENPPIISRIKSMFRYNTHKLEVAFTGGHSQI